MPKKKVNDELDADLQAELEKANSHEERVELLLLMILRELKHPGGGPK